jgi:hypothetical protein
MHVCSKFPCGMTSAGCHDPYCPSKPALLPMAPLLSLPSPRTLPVNIPFSNLGVTVVVLDHTGNLTIKVDQVPPDDHKA